MAYAIDSPAPATVILISGDRDFVYAVSVLCLRQYRVIVMAPTAAHASLKGQASVVYAWPGDVLPEAPSEDGTKSRATTIPDFFRAKSEPTAATLVRTGEPAPASPPPSPAAPRRPIPISVASDTASLRPPVSNWWALGSSASPSLRKTVLSGQSETVSVSVLLIDSVA